MNEVNAHKLLFDVADVLDFVGLPFCLGAGTLLGAIRESRFIPIDRDIDLWSRAEDFEPIVGTLVDEMRTRGMNPDVIDHRHAGYWDGRAYAVKFSKYGEHGDLTTFTKLGPYRYNPTHGSRDPFCIVFGDGVFGIWRKTKFYGREFQVPVASTEVLSELYGNWNVPDTQYDQPCEHRAYKSKFLTKQEISYVPMCLDVLHPGHLNMLQQAAKLERNVWIGLLSDEAIRKYKPSPLFDYSAREAIAMGLSGVSKVVCQDDYMTSMLELRPAYLLHGDDWCEGVQSVSRQIVKATLPHWGGKLVEVPYTTGYSSSGLKIEMQSREEKINAQT